jgi:hypothetical protein
MSSNIRERIFGEWTGTTAVTPQSRARVRLLEVRIVSQLLSPACSRKSGSRLNLLSNFKNQDSKQVVGTTNWSPVWPMLKDVLHINLTCASAGMGKRFIQGKT